MIDVMTKMKIASLPFLVSIVIILIVNPTHMTTAKDKVSWHLMPMPMYLEAGQGKLCIDNSFCIRLTGHRDSRLPAAASRMLQRLQRITGIPFTASPAGETSAPKEATLEIHCSGSGEPVQSISADESYTLEIDTRRARLAAPSPIGILRGLETFLQLVDLDDQSFFVPAVKIIDRPRFPWRGLLIDVSRHWEPGDVIKRNLDAMAAVKMNVFHWHLSDDQGFRVESRRFPKLQKIASEGKYYTQTEVREIIDYARDRGIRVIPEFDMPGHATAWLVAYPELASAPGPYQIERFWGVFEPCLDPAQNRLYSFLDSFIGEMAALFPDAYFHIGGDEVHPKQWNSSARIQSFKERNGLKDNRDLQAYFNKRLQKILEKHGKKMIGWDEILHPDLPHSIVVQSWRGQKYLAESAHRGYLGILSYGYYLDHMQPASFHFKMDPLDPENVELTQDEKKLILGGEACMWGEFVNPENIESRIWPRTAAIAERLWSPVDVQDIPDMYRRLEYLNDRLELFGLMHASHYRAMLQRMVGDEKADMLKTIADLLQPSGLGGRVRARKYSSLVPLNRMVDAVLPESKAARYLGNLIDKLLADPQRSPDLDQKIRESLVRWRDIKDPAKPVLEQSFLLAEVEPVVDTVSQLCTAGLKALEYIESNEPPPKAWQLETSLLFQKAEKPQAEMFIAIAPQIKKLVDAADAIR